jgi:hypothetical protein
MSQKRPARRQSSPHQRRSPASPAAAPNSNEVGIEPNREPAPLPACEAPPDGVLDAVLSGVEAVDRLATDDGDDVATVEKPDDVAEAEDAEAGRERVLDPEEATPVAPIAAAEWADADAAAAADEREMGTGMSLVAEGSGWEKEPVIWSSLSSGSRSVR